SDRRIERRYPASDFRVPGQAGECRRRSGREVAGDEIGRITAFARAEGRRAGEASEIRHATCLLYRSRRPSEAARLLGSNVGAGAPGFQDGSRGASKRKAEAMNVASTTVAKYSVRKTLTVETSAERAFRVF